jgi:hypothetical protein
MEVQICRALEWRGKKPLDWRDTKELLKGGGIRPD